MFYRSCCIAIILGMAITSCNSISVPTPTNTVVAEPAEDQATSPPRGKPTMVPLDFKTSEPGYFTIKGQLMVTNPMMMAPGRDDAMYLVPMDGQEENLTTIPPFEIGEVPQAEVDERNGEFVYTNIEPGVYAVVVETLEGSRLPARLMENDSIAIITIDELDENKMIDLGVLVFP